jgi:hypothetical protein
MRRITRGGVMVGETCSCIGCHTEVLAWIDGGAWCGGHALRVLAGQRPLEIREDEVGATRARRFSEHDTSRHRFTVLMK